MNGHFETNQTAYPIGYLSNNNGYRVTDMRNLHNLHSQFISKEQAVRIASEANVQLQQGVFTLQDGDERCFEFVAAQVAEL